MTMPMDYTKAATDDELLAMLLEDIRKNHMQQSAPLDAIGEEINHRETSSSVFNDSTPVVELVDDNNVPDPGSFSNNDVLDHEVRNVNVQNEDIQFHDHGNNGEAIHLAPVRRAIDPAHHQQSAARSLNLHELVQKVPGTNFWECIICRNHQYKDKNGAMRHVRSKHVRGVPCPLSNPVVPCGVAGQVFHRSDHLQAHAKVMHPCEPRRTFTAALIALNRGKSRKNAASQWVEGGLDPLEKGHTSQGAQVQSENSSQQPSDVSECENRQTIQVRGTAPQDDWYPNDAISQHGVWHPDDHTTQHGNWVPNNPIAQPDNRQPENDPVQHGSWHTENNTAQHGSGPTYCATTIQQSWNPENLVAQDGNWEMQNSIEQQGDLQPDNNPSQHGSWPTYNDNTLQESCNPENLIEQDGNWEMQNNIARPADWQPDNNPSQHASWPAYNETISQESWYPENYIAQHRRWPEETGPAQPGSWSPENRFADDNTTAHHGNWYPENPIEQYGNWYPQNEISAENASTQHSNWNPEDNESHQDCWQAGNDIAQQWNRLPENGLARERYRSSAPDFSQSQNFINQCQTASHGNAPASHYDTTQTFTEHDLESLAFVDIYSVEQAATAGNAQV
ncbi:hypothetical protein EDC01DRAFT_635306 [Geopyxis carbonaria]|nr:hypothetical protein EDC01DRAFT_635306 [Geopyxis carbonaria]